MTKSTSKNDGGIITTILNPDQHRQSKNGSVQKSTTVLQYLGQMNGGSHHSSSQAVVQGIKNLNKSSQATFAEAAMATGMADIDRDYTDQKTRYLEDNIHQRLPNRPLSEEADGDSRQPRGVNRTTTGPLMVRDEGN